MFRFKLKAGQHKTSKIIFCSPWIAGDLMGAIALKDEYLTSHPEYYGCLVKWEKKQLSNNK
jgi:hypothetical protein